MKTTHVMTNVMLAAVIGIFAFSGCGSVEQSRTGFLSDYSRLREVSNENYRYVDERAVDKYSSFIVDEVKVHFFTGASAVKAKSEGKVTAQDLKDLTNYIHSAIVKSISDSGRKVVNQT